MYKKIVALLFLMMLSSTSNGMLRQTFVYMKHTKAACAFNKAWQGSLQWYSNHEKPVNWVWCATGFIGFPATMYAAWNTRESKRLLQHDLAEERAARQLLADKLSKEERVRSRLELHIELLDSEIEKLKGSRWKVLFGGKQI